MKTPELKYNYSALEPHIDAKTMEIHHSKHHAGYTNNLNKAIAGTGFETKSIEDILKTPNLPAPIRNNGGGYYNHCLFWEILSPNPTKGSKEFIRKWNYYLKYCEAAFFQKNISVVQLVYSRPNNLLAH